MTLKTSNCFFDVLLAVAVVVFPPAIRLHAPKRKRRTEIRESHRLQTKKTRQFQDQTGVFASFRQEDLKTKTL